MLIHYLVLIFLWLVYGLLHSALASFTVKNYTKKHLGNAYRYYRILYNFIAIIGLLGILLYNAVISSHILVPGSWLPFLKFVGLVFATWGILIIRLAFRKFSLKEFLGFAQAQQKTTKNEILRTDGILQHIRHPIYSGTLLLIVGFWLFSPTLANLITTFCITIYTLIGMRLEEKKLIATFGDAYRQYKQKVPALVPSLESLKSLF